MSRNRCRSLHKKEMSQKNDSLNRPCGHLSLASFWKNDALQANRSVNKPLSDQWKFYSEILFGSEAHVQMDASSPPKSLISTRTSLEVFWRFFGESQVENLTKTLSDQFVVPCMLSDFSIEKLIRNSH